MKYCKKCGKKVDGRKKFCTNCGADLKDKENVVIEEIKKEESYSNNGYIDRVKLKLAARDKIKGRLWDIWMPYLVIAVISFVLQSLVGCFFETESDTYNTLLGIIEICMLPMTFGYISYILNFVRGKELDYREIFKFYNEKFVYVLLLSMLMTLFITLWCFLLIVPGIIAALSYTMSTYLFVDNYKQDKPMDIIKESKRMMYGYKGDYFIFALSFILWILFAIVTLGIGIIYVYPYVMVSNTMYYEELKKIKNN